MFVWIVQEYEPYEGADLKGIYSTEEKAQEALEHLVELGEEEWKGGGAWVRNRLQIERVAVDDSPV